MVDIEKCLTEAISNIQDPTVDRKFNENYKSKVIIKREKGENKNVHKNTNAKLQ